MFGKKKGFESLEIRSAIKEIQSKYKSLVVEYGLNSALKDFFAERLSHAISAKRTPEKFIEEEMSELSKLKENAQKQEIKNIRKLKAHERVVSEQTFADKVIRQENRTIERYFLLEIHPHADPEICRLYGAINQLDKDYWVVVEAHLRKFFPRSGNIKRASIEQRLWQFTPSHENKLPESLKRYHYLLELPTSSKKDLFLEAQAAVKTVAFFLHDVVEFCESNMDQPGAKSDELDATLNYIRGIIKDFRLRELKQA